MRLCNSRLRSSSTRRPRNSNTRRPRSSNTKGRLPRDRARLL